MSEEVCNEIGAAIALWVHFTQPSQKGVSIVRGDALSTQKRRISYEGVEAGIETAEDLGKLELPVEGRNRTLSCARLAQLGYKVTQRLQGTTTRQALGDFRFPVLAQQLALLVVLAAKEAADHAVCVQPDLIERRACLLVQLNLVGIVIAIGERLDLLAQRLRIRERTIEASPQKRNLLARLPVERCDLLPRQTDQRVTVPQRMVHKGKRVQPCQRGQPQRQLAQIHRKRVFVDAVQTLLGDKPLRKQRPVFIVGLVVGTTVVLPGGK